MEFHEYTQYDALGLAGLVKRGEFTPNELIDTCKRALAKINPQINAVIGSIEPIVDEYESNPEASFAGVPFLLKDIGHGYAGVQCDMGSRLAKGFSFDNDSDCAKRFKSSGLIAIGRSNTPEFGMSGTTEPILYGPTRNPWDTSLTTGGSSGGAAAAVATGIFPIAHASDAGGSIRIPAAWAGLIGHKPSRGYIPKGPMTSDGANWLAEQFIVSRSIRDTAAMMDALSGPALGDYIYVPKPYVSFSQEMLSDPGRLRIALCTEFDDSPATHPDCVEAVMSAAKLCEELGHIVEEAKPPINCMKTHKVGYYLFLPLVVKFIDELSQKMDREIGPDTLEAINIAAYESGKTFPMKRFVSSIEEINTMSRIMGNFMADYDVLLSPTVTRPPFELGLMDTNRKLSSGIDYWLEECVYYTTNILFNITGQPAITLPLHWNADGLPLGVQFVSPIGMDALLFKLAHQLERARPWFDKYPPVHITK